MSTGAAVVGYAAIVLWNDEDWKKLGPARFMLLGLSGLNMYWFKKIIEMARKQT